MISSMTFAQSIACSLMFYFQNLGKPPSLKLSKTYSNLADHIFVDENEVLLALFLQNLDTILEYFYFHGNIVI